MDKNNKLDPEVYREFITGVELLSLRLISVDAKIDDKYFSHETDVSIKVEDKAKYSDSDRGGGFSAFHDYDISLSCEGQEKPYISFKAQFEVIYSSEIAINKKIWDVFKNVNLPLNTWPYVRELFHNTVLRFNHPPVILPAIKR